MESTKAPSQFPAPRSSTKGSIKFEVPLPQDLTRELLEFWAEIFGGYSDLTPGSVSGEEIEHNRHLLYLTRSGDRLAGTCLLTMAKAAPGLAGLSGVATGTAFRRSGIASDLCSRSVDEFRRGAGQAIFLGTGNTAAARVYYRLGWRKLAGTNVMANILSGGSPESFLTSYFQSPAPITIRPASPSDRIPIIPLIVSPHDWQVLDANVGIYSPRSCVQHSCIGLFRKYVKITEGGRGTWFSVWTTNGRVVGLSTARLDGDGGCQVDGFTHRHHASAWEELIQAAMDWGVAAGASRCWVVASLEDEEKQGLFESLGYRGAGLGSEFSLDGRAVASVRMEWTPTASPPLVA